MTTFVIDASVALKWFIPEIHEAEAKRFLDPGNILYAPDLLPSEFGNILLKKVRRAEITADEAERIAGEMQNSPVILTSSLDLLSDAPRLAVATGRTVYDSMYLALAADRSCRLVTADRKLWNALQHSPYDKLVHWSRTDSTLS
jgi:predicted nucleic acid-binding protein